MIVINFYSDSPAAIADRFINNFNSSISADAPLVDYETGADSGIRLRSPNIIFPLSGAGRNVGADALTQAINAEVAEFLPATSAALNFTFFNDVKVVDIDVYLTTTLPQLSNVDVTVGGETQSFSPQGNTTGAVLTFENVYVGEGFGSVVVANQSISPDLVVNGIRLHNLRGAQTQGEGVAFGDTVTAVKSTILTAPFNINRGVIVKG